MVVNGCGHRVSSVGKLGETIITEGIKHVKVIISVSHERRRSRGLLLKGSIITPDFFNIVDELRESTDKHIHIIAKGEEGTDLILTGPSSVRGVSGKDIVDVTEGLRRQHLKLITSVGAALCRLTGGEVPEPKEISMDGNKVRNVKNKSIEIKKTTKPKKVGRPRKTPSKVRPPKRPLRK